MISMKKLIVLLLLSNVAFANTPPNPARMLGDVTTEAKESASATTESLRQIGVVDSGMRQVVLYMQGDEPLLKLSGLEVDDVKSYFLPNPPRLVFDYFLKRDAFWNTAKRLDSPEVKGIRIGKHPNRIRIVLDLPENSSLKNAQFKTEMAGDSVIMASLSLDETRILAAKESGSDKDSSIRARAIRNSNRDSSVSSSKDDSAETSASSNPNEQKALAAVQRRETFPTINSNLSRTSNAGESKAGFNASSLSPNKATANALGTSYALEQIQFVELRPSMMKTIKLQFNSLAKFELKKIDERTWVIELKAKLKDMYLAKAFFPPISYKGIYVVQAQQKDDNLSVKIGVEKGYKVSALPKDNAIWIKVDK